MTDTQALRDLLDAIEVGGELPRPLPFPVWQSALVLEAYRGSLDAAKALHDAVLPGWDCYLKIAADKNPHRAELRPLTPMSGNPSIIIQWGEYPARAWLIAILRALIAQAEQ